jgi:hypothetical protein
MASDGAADGRNAQSYRVFDRYGAGARAPSARPPEGGPEAGTVGRYLYGSGKPAVAPAAPVPSAALGQEPPVPNTAEALRARSWTFTSPIGANPGPVPAPTALSSIYDPPPPLRAPAPVKQPAEAARPDTDATGPRRYSVNRDYGVEPDAIPLPPQFFGATADLSQPATADPIRKTATASGKAVNPLQPSDGQ